MTPAAEAGHRIRRKATPAFPLGSIAALLVLAVVAWTLAGWNDARRTDRQQAGSQQAESHRAGKRLAEQPPSAEEPVIR